MGDEWQSLKIIKHIQISLLVVMERNFWGRLSFQFSFMLIQESFIGLVSVFFYDLIEVISLTGGDRIQKDKKPVVNEDNDSRKPTVEPIVIPT